ncbi:sensor histidine kinase [Paenibacillus aceris]|uniref:Two-component system sensor histidine kinase YesM n=1 Tax=Paenibacillus aceris TaxID=869555 RepID=A0ABS4I3U2_9BACL|nr:histidine kinase [Paenibacillus aceris]MBP1965475.1 two-component system sensor histidine kinase YesM [Paenibacillus aceris]NHW33475.1 sensor histidine kinase [Paenibacillus aceris]
MKNRLRSIFSTFRFQRLRSRFLVAMIIISLPPLFILGYISFNIAKNTLMETNAQTYENHLETSSEVADLLFRSIINMNRSIVVNNEVREVLFTSNVPQSSEPNSTSEWSSNKLQKAINSNQFDTKFVNSICVLNLDFKTFCAGRSDDAGIYEKPDKARLIQQSQWYQSALQDQGKVVFLGYDIFQESKNSFSTVKLFRDASSPNGEAIGMLVVNISTAIFNNIFNENSNAGGFMALDNSTELSKIVFNNGLASDSSLNEGNKQSLIQQLEKQGYLISQYQNQTTEWTFIHLIKVNELLKQSNKIRTVTTLIAVSMGIIALLYSIFISGSITRPLLTIKKMMVEWTKGAREFDETFEQDEVGTIGETFKRVVYENKQLNERLIHSELKEREAELRALQAQIKPHFLYNTLDSIYWMATLQKNHDVAQMAISLSESFKLSLNKGKETISVYKELKHIEHYMTIQNIRYHNRFTYVEEVEPVIMSMDIMKLLLQPLVENAIYHGLEPKVGKGMIRLTGKREDGLLVFTVEDDGVGIADLAATQQGYGLKNVRERLALYYGDTSSLTISSEVNQGTQITIRFQPFAEKRDADA